MTKKMKKLLPNGKERRQYDLLPTTIKQLTIQAAEVGTVLKPFIEDILEKHANKSKSI